MNKGFESIKNHLLEQGFEYKDNLFIKTQQRQQLVVINGQQRQLVQEVKTEFEYLGDGYVESADGTQEETCGMCLKVNGQELVEVWVRDAQEFQQLLSV
jgi:hypothetical protein